MSRAILAARGFASSGAKPLIGVHQVGLYGFATSPTNDLADLNYMGANVTRGAVEWRTHESSQGSYNWGQMDSYVNGMNNGGITVIGFIIDAPQWATGSSDPVWVPWLQGQSAWDTFCARIASFATVLSARYGTKLVYELWNEEGAVGGFWKPVSTNKSLAILRYGQMFTAVRSAILAQVPSATIMIGGLTNLPGGNNTIIGGTEFITGLMQNGVVFDHLGIHPYCNREETGDNNDPGIHYDDANNNYDDVVLVYNTLQANQNYRNVKLWSTECGNLSSTVLGETTQANYVETIYRRADSGFEGRIPPGVIKGTNYFICRDHPAFPGTGLFTSNGSPKQSATRVRNYIINNPRT